MNHEANRRGIPAYRYRSTPIRTGPRGSHLESVQRRYPQLVRVGTGPLAVWLPEYDLPPYWRPDRG